LGEKLLGYVGLKPIPFLMDTVASLICQLIQCRAQSDQLMVATR
jgi:hypothetical protein